MTTRPSDPSRPNDPPEQSDRDEDIHEETGNNIPIFRMTKLAVEDEQTRVANAPSLEAEELGPPVQQALRSGTHATERKKRAERYAFATEALVTTPGGKQCVCRTVNVSPKGLLADGPKWRESPLRLGMVCRVRLRRKTREIEFDAEIVRVDPPRRNGRPAFAFRISFLTREAQAELLRLIEDAKSPAVDEGSRALVLSVGSVAKLGAALLVVALAATAGWYLTRRERALPVATTTLVRGSIADVITSRSGEIIAERRVIVRSSLAVPTTMKLSVRRGDRVTAGTVLAEESGDTARLALIAARNKLVAAQAKSAHASQVADEASALPDDATTQRAEKIEHAQEAARRARDALAAAQLERDARANDVKKSQIIAPFDGVVVDVKIQPGDLVAPTAPICDLLDDTALRVNAQFDEADIGRIKERALVQVAVTGHKSIIRGAVDRIGEVVQAEAKTHVVLVEVALLERPPLRPGTTAKVEIVLDTAANALLLPRSALLGQEGRRTVFVVGENGELAVREVQVGIVATDFVEVLQGPPEGSVIVADATASGLANGLRVRPIAR